MYESDFSSYLHIFFQVLFLGSGDLRNVLVTVSQSSEAYHKFDIHLSDSCECVTARNFLIAHILLSEAFDPTITADIQYLWNIWYGCQWNETTRKRFINDVENVLACNWSNPHSSVILHEDPSNECVKRILNHWLTLVSTMTTDFVNKIVEQRYSKYCFFFLSCLHVSIFLFFQKAKFN
jgi:hypothetical protein